MSEKQQTPSVNVLCRLCTHLLADQFIAENLFDGNQRKLLRQIEELIGQRLKNVKDLPQHICKSCKANTVQAHVFRTQCLRAQLHFAVQKRKQSSLQKKFKPKNKVYPTEELVINEQKESKENEALPEDLFKHEPMITNSDDDFKADDSNDASFNPLDEDHFKTSDEEDDETDKAEVKKDDMMILEPEIRLNAHAETLPIKKEIKTQKKYIENNKSEKTKRVVSNEKPIFICDQCGRNFKNNCLLQTHLRRHRGEKIFKCESCADSFYTKNELNRHKRKHTGQLPYSCKICERRYMDHSSVKKHMRTHTNERPYVCQHCGRGFTVSNTLTHHMLTHTNERAFSCKICNVAFKRKIHLKTHCSSMTHKQNEENYQMNTNNLWS